MDYLDIVLYMKSGKTHNVTTTEFENIMDFVNTISNEKGEWVFFLNQGIAIKLDELESYNVREGKVQLGKK